MLVGVLRSYEFEKRVAGRVEHVASGQSTHFVSLEELLAFMGQVLTTVRAPPGRRRAG